MQKDLSSDILINPKDIQKTFQNIITNAIEFSNKFSTIKLYFIKNKSEYIISVVDSGTGFSNESLKKATEKFYSQNKASSDSHYGLGLFIFEKIMNENNVLLKLKI